MYVILIRKNSSMAFLRVKFIQRPITHKSIQRCSKWSLKQRNIFPVFYLHSTGFQPFVLPRLHEKKLLWTTYKIHGTDDVHKYQNVFNIYFYSNTFLKSNKNTKHDWHFELNICMDIHSIWKFTGNVVICQLKMRLQIYKKIDFFSNLQTCSQIP